MIELPLSYAATTLFEIPLTRLAGRVPAPLSPIEVRPGVGLVSVTMCRVQEGGVHGAHGPLPAYDEVVFCVHVDPDLERGVPDLAMLVLTFAATEARALAANADHHDLPVLDRPIRVTLDGHRQEVSDADGPIANLTCEHPTPRYEQRPAVLQVYTPTESGVRTYDETFEARSFRHQRRAPCAVLHDHPLFAGVDVSGLTRPFLQWVCEPGRVLVQRASVPTRPVGGLP
ncbi:MAG: hypothetical protein KC621_22065 [Myxococcales bacterium]|nr:hypothetical protein [Myxococcales bacterium]